MERKEQSAHSMNATAGGTTATGGCAGENLSDQLTILQELYQRKQAELVAQLHQSQSIATQEYLQSLQLLQQRAVAANAAAAAAVAATTTTAATTVAPSAPHVQQIEAVSAQLPSGVSQHHPLLGNLRQASSEHSTDEVDMQQQHGGGGGSTTGNSSPLSLKESNSNAARNRRTFSGSGQTISQTTRDRLKTMIASKKQKQKLYECSSGGGGSSTNLPLAAIASNGSAAGKWNNNSSFNNGHASELNSGGATMQSSSLRGSLKESAGKQSGAFTPHFEPYPHPSPVTSAATAAAAINGSEFQLRKVNSEPNLKMRIRARLLNKGSSPVTQHQQPVPNTSNHTSLQRCDSDCTPLAMLKTNPISAISAAAEKLQAAQSTSTLQLQLPPNMIIPSPSLPNLCNGVDSNNIPLDYTNLMMQASTFASFLSLPSLLKNPLLQPNSILDPCSTSMDTLLNANFGNRNNVKFDNRTAFNSPLPVGGYPSLLKQQLRDLVLRRKSLVREEPEDESMVEVIAQHFQKHINPNNQLKTGLAYDVSMSKHQCLCGENQNHVEHGGRVQSIWSRLQEIGLVNMCERLTVKKASLDLLKLAHSSTYVTFFAVSPTACLKMDPSELPLKSFVQLPCGGIGVDSDTYFNDASTQMAIRVAVGLLVELACQVVEGKLRNGFACIRPPGHHAEREQAMGFCFFNNVSIAARHLQQRFSDRCQRIAIVDWDVHHGNGTQLCFEQDPDILYISMHRHDNGNFFPGTGAVTEVGKDEGKGFTVNIPFSGDVMGDAEYLAAWRVLVLPLLDSFKPDFILVSSGFDAARGHPAALGGYEISPQLFGYFTRTLMSFANGKVVLALEGGYDLSSICESAEECVKALCTDGGEISNISPEALDRIPNQSAQDTIQKVLAVHKKHWPCLTGVQGINTSELHWQTISHRFSSLTVHA